MAKRTVQVRKGGNQGSYLNHGIPGDSSYDFLIHPIVPGVPHLGTASGRTIIDRVLKVVGITSKNPPVVNPRVNPGVNQGHPFGDADASSYPGLTFRAQR